jgi:N-acetylglutamate synthase-like GNAT family acetyltransferase
MKPVTPVIRPARSTDLTNVQDLLILSGLGDFIPPDSFTGILLIAEHEGQVVGVIHALPGEPCAFITLMAVHPDTQKAGVAYALQNGMELALRLAGSRRWVAFIDDEKWGEAVTRYGAKPFPNVGRLFKGEL